MAAIQRLELWEMLDNGSIETPQNEQELWNGAKGYFKYCDANPIINKMTIMVGKDAGKKIDKETARPYSIKGLCLYCGITEEWLKDIRKTKKKDSMYHLITSRIFYVIYVQNLELAMTGIYNPIIVAKVLGMDNDDASVAGPVTVNIVSGLPILSNSENEVLEKLELEKGTIIKRN